jgi:hypothetical protein
VTFWRTVAKELVLVETTDNDQSSCSRVLVFLGFTLRAFLAPFALHNLERGFKSVVDQSLYQAIIRAVVQLDLPDNRCGWRNAVGYWTGCKSLGQQTATHVVSESVMEFESLRGAGG